MELPRCLRVGKSAIAGAGKGVFSRECVPGNCVLGFYKGKIHTKRACDYLRSTKLLMLERKPTWISIDDWIDGKHYVDGARNGNWTQYINGSDHPGNPMDANVRFTGNGKIITTRLITPGEELLMEYGEEYWEDILQR